MADDPEVPLDDEAKELLLLEKKLEARKNIAQLTGTSLPEIKPVADTLSLGEKGGGSIAAVEAARAAKLAAAAIVDEVVKIQDVATVVIVEDRAVAQNDIALAEVTTRLAGFSNAFTEIEENLPDPFKAIDEKVAPALLGAALPALLGIAGLASTVVGMFRADYSVSSREAAPDKLALIAEVIRGLKTSGKRVLLPGLGLVAEAPVITTFQELVNRRYAIERRVGVAENGRVTPRSHELEAARARLAHLHEAADTYFAEGKDVERERAEARIKEVTDRIATIEGDETYARTRAAVSVARGVLTAFDSVAAALITPATTGYAPLIAAALRQKVKDVAGENPHLLFVDHSTAGADVVTRTSTIRFGARAAFLGAAGVTYILANADGSIVGAGTFHRVSTSTYDFEALQPGKSSDWTRD